MISIPIKPLGIFNDLNILTTIKTNKIVEKISGNEIMGVKAKADTNGSVRI
jgi:hypothetical protein